MGGWVPFLIALLLNYVQPKHDVEVERFVEAWPVPVEAKTDSLLYVQVAWRHGDRTPAISVPFSDADTWNEGLGELTKRGIAQQYRLGKWLRARYGKWLGDHFDRSQVFVRSSDYNRTLMSAQANMAGLFPPSKLEMWDAGLAWQPVPVHSIPKSIDKELYEDIECPTASAEFNKVWKLGVVRRMEAENEDLIQYLREHSQIVDFQFYMLWMVYDNLFCMHQHNDTQTWPSWMNVTLFNRLQKLYDASSRLKYHTEVLRRLRGGPLLKDIVERFLAKTSGALGDKPKLYAYSAHDTTLAAVLSTLGIYPTEFPKYASAVLLELHGVGGQFVVEIWAPSPNQISLIGRCFDLWEQFRVLVVGYEYGYAQSLLIVFQNRLVSYKIYHKNMTDVDDVYRYVIPDCPDPCTLDALRSTVQKYLPTDWTEECGLSGPNAINYMISTVVFALTTALLAGFIALDVALKRRRHSFATDPLMIDDDDV